MTDTQLLTQSEAAELLRLKPKTLARWRWDGKGPAYRKIGGAVRYSATDLQAFVEASIRHSTSAVEQQAINDD